MTKMCPPLRVSCDDSTEGDYADYSCKVDVQNGGRSQRVGEMDLKKQGSKLLQVAYVEINKPFRGCGIGTKLYEGALRLACEEDRRLSSDFSRTHYSDSFWRKQVRKGRASCVLKSGGKKLDDRFFDTKEPWDCGVYAMNDTCPASQDLSGLRRKRRPKKSRR